MFGKCLKCKTLESEVLFLREEVRRLSDRLLAVTQPLAYQAIQFPNMHPEDCYGSDTDEMIDYGQMGQKVIRVKNRVN